MSTSEPHLALLTSPLLGRSVWQPAADHLKSCGWQVAIAAHEGPAPASSNDVLTAFVEQLDVEQEWVLVPHSNAGVFVPAVAAQRQVRAAIYVDARLPQAQDSYPMSSSESIAFLSSLADSDGILPRWSEWWDHDIGGLFPTREWRERAEAEMRRLPLSYFLDDVLGAEISPLPSAYVAFGDTYGHERATAENDGWPVATLPGDHLLLVMQPTDVAATVDRLVRTLLDPASPTSA